MGVQLKKIAGSTFYIKGPVNAGVYARGDGKCILIDTGLDETTGRQILKCLDEKGLIPYIIINTHSHADHFGANAIIKERSAAKVYATKIEKAIIENPYLEPFYLFSAAPFKEISNKFLMAAACRVDGIINDELFEPDGVKFNIVSLKGHSPGQIGIVTPDNVFFTADSYFSDTIIKKYQLPYFTDINSTKKTLNSLMKTSYSYYLPSHGNLTKDPLKTLEANLKTINDTEEVVLETLIQEKNREELLLEIVDRYKIQLNPNQYVLTLSAVSAYLSDLKDRNLIDILFKNNGVYWKTIK